MGSRPLHQKIPVTILFQVMNEMSLELKKRTPAVWLTKTNSF